MQRRKLIPWGKSVVKTNCRITRCQQIFKIQNLEELVTAERIYQRCHAIKLLNDVCKLRNVFLIHGSSNVLAYN